MHRQAYEEAYGPIPPGAFVCHHCDTPACYEPTHLFVGSHADNMADMVRKGRGRNHGGLIGTRNPAAKLTEELVAAIRIAYRGGEGSQEAIGQRFGVGQSQVSSIIRGESWRTVQP